MRETKKINVPPYKRNHNAPRKQLWKKSDLDQERNNDRVLKAAAVNALSDDLLTSCCTDIGHYGQNENDIYKDPYDADASVSEIEIDCCENGEQSIWCNCDCQRRSKVQLKKKRVVYRRVINRKLFTQKKP